MRRSARTTFVVSVAVLGLAVGLAPAAISPTAQAGIGFSPGSKDVVVHLFQWPWESVAQECTDVLGPAGVGAVQVSPPQEHVVLSGEGHPWWQDYQPVSYQLESRRGDRAAFADMVATCQGAGVDIYVDAILNHMAGGASEGTGPGSGGSQFTHFEYPAVPYGFDDFHHCGRHGDDVIRDWADRWEVQNCMLVNLADLKTESSYVRGQLAGYLNDLRSLGVNGFRVDAAKHVPVADIQAVFDQVDGTPYVFNEVIEGGPGEINPTEYTGIGDVTEFRYGTVVANAFRDANLANLNNLANEMLLAGDNAVVFINNHDTQRDGRARLTYQDGASYALAEAFMLAWPYGTPKILSSYDFTSHDQGPPATSDGTTTQVTCGDGWLCEHRWRTNLNLVEFRNTAAGTGVSHWWSNGWNQIAFGRTGTGYVAFNRDSGPLNRTFQTDLPAGVYCDVANGDFADGTCSGATHTVDANGRFIATVPANGMLALHVNARTSTGGGGGCTTVATTFAVDATTVWGENVHVVGNRPELGNWNTANAVPLAADAYPIWQGTVQLPPSTTFEYKYIKKTDSGQVIWENDPNRSQTTPADCSVTYSETWNVHATPECEAVSTRFKVDATTVLGENVHVVGNRPELGNWNTANAVPLSADAYPIWQGTVELPRSTTFEYKYIKKADSGQVIWESGGNRSQATAMSCTATFTDTWRS